MRHRRLRALSVRERRMPPKPPAATAFRHGSHIARGHVSRARQTQCIGQASRDIAAPPRCSTVRHLLQSGTPRDTTSRSQGPRRPLRIRSPHYAEIRHPVGALPRGGSPPTHSLRRNMHGSPERERRFRFPVDGTDSAPVCTSRPAFTARACTRRPREPVAGNRERRWTLPMRLSENPSATIWRSCARSRQARTPEVNG